MESPPAEAEGIVAERFLHLRETHRARLADQAGVELGDRLTSLDELRHDLLERLAMLPHQGGELDLPASTH